MESYELIILDVAEESFACNGFANTKMMDLAKKANINHALIHYYYRTKDKLYESVVKRLFQRWDEQVKAFRWTGDDPARVLTNYIECYFRFYVENTNFQRIRIWDEMENRNLFSAYTEQFWKQDLEEKNQIFKIWKEKKLIRPDVNGRLLLYSIWALIKYFYSTDELGFQMIFQNTDSLEDNRNHFIKQIADSIVERVVI